MVQKTAKKPNKNWWLSHPLKQREALELPTRNTHELIRRALFPASPRTNISWFQARRAMA